MFYQELRLSAKDAFHEERSESKHSIQEATAIVRQGARWR